MAELDNLERRIRSLEKAGAFDHRIPRLATDFDLEDAVFPPCASVYHDDVGSIDNGAWGALLFNTENYDTDNMHDLTANTDRLTARTPGKYRISGGCAFAGNATGQRLIKIYYNGTTDITFGNSDAGRAAGNNLFTTTSYHLDKDEYVNLQVYHDIDGGGALGVVAGRHFEMEWFAP